MIRISEIIRKIRSPCGPARPPVGAMEIQIDLPPKPNLKFPTEIIYRNLTLKRKILTSKKPDFPVNEKNQIFSRVPQRPSTAGLAGRKTIQKIQFPTNIIQHFPQKIPNNHGKFAFKGKQIRQKKNQFVQPTAPLPEKQ